MIIQANVNCANLNQMTTGQEKGIWCNTAIRSIYRIAFAVVAVLSVAACAGTPSDPMARAMYLEANDPIEPFNRGVYGFNKALDSGFIKPVATTYRDSLPQTPRNAIRNFLNNLRAPVILANNILQGDIDAAKVTIARFMTNTIVGFGGFGDPASDLGAKFRNEDFGQTMAVWGLGEGPYIMLPLLGPSNPRDAIGIVVDSFLDPFNTWADNTGHGEAPMARKGVHGIDLRSRHIKNLDDLEKSSLDFYTTIRSLHRQFRTDAITNGDAGDSIPSPSISFDDGDNFLGQSAKLKN